MQRDRDARTLERTGQASGTAYAALSARQSIRLSGKTRKTEERPLERRVREPHSGPPHSSPFPLRRSPLPYANIPAIEADVNAARFPAIIARSPSAAMSFLRSGANPPMPPIWIAIDEKFANPSSA